MKVTLDRLRGEYLEMPGLRLTVAQAQRLCGIERDTCQAVLDALVDAKFLCVKPNGMYARASDGQHAKPRPIAAGINARAPFAAAS